MATSRSDAAVRPEPSAAGWTRGERGLIVDAVRSAPSVHSGQPWVLRFADGYAAIHERIGRPDHDDPLGRDRLLSCGAALANLVLAVRVLGWTSRLDLFCDPTQPDEVGRVSPTGRQEPSHMDTEWYAVLGSRHSHRAPFVDAPLPDSLRAELVDAAGTHGVQPRPIRPDEVPAVAALLRHAATMTGGFGGERDETSLPWVRGPAPAMPPDPATLAARMRAEYLLLFLTPDDGKADQVRAGIALQRTWLAATAAGLGCSVLTRPLFVPAVRGTLVDDLGLPGHPQVLLRIGYPVTATGRRSGR